MLGRAHRDEPAVGSGRTGLAVFFSPSGTQFKTLCELLLQFVSRQTAMQDGWRHTVNGPNEHGRGGEGLASVNYSAVVASGGKTEAKDLFPNTRQPPITSGCLACSQDAGGAILRYSRIHRLLAPTSSQKLDCRTLFLRRLFRPAHPPALLARMQREETKAGAPAAGHEHLVAVEDDQNVGRASNANCYLVTCPSDCLCDLVQPAGPGLRGRHGVYR
jgi:hypothetical protein